MLSACTTASQMPRKRCTYIFTYRMKSARKREGKLIGAVLAYMRPKMFRMRRPEGYNYHTEYSRAGECAPVPNHTRIYPCYWTSRKSGQWLARVIHTSSSTFGLMNAPK